MKFMGEVKLLERLVKKIHLNGLKSPKLITNMQRSETTLSAEVTQRTGLHTWKDVFTLPLRNTVNTDRNLNLHKFDSRR